MEKEPEAGPQEGSAVRRKNAQEGRDERRRCWRAEFSITVAKESTFLV